MSSQKKIFSGQFGDDTINLVRGLIHISTLEGKSQYYNWHIAPHAHNNLFQIFIIETGTATLLHNDERLLIEVPAFFTVPVNVSHGLDMAPSVTGWVISLSDLMVQHMLRLDVEIILKFDGIYTTRVDMQNELVAAAYITMHKCIDEYNSSLPVRNFALQYLVGMLLTRFYRLLPTAEPDAKAATNAAKLHFRRFLQLTKESYSVQKSVAEYAQEMTVTPGYLNRICQRVAGESPKDVIIHFFISEAESLLVHFEYSIAEISYQLHFDDPGYFARLFKKKTGLTPKEYRAKAPGK